MKLLAIAALFLQAHMAPVLTYYDYDTHDINKTYSGEIVYNPTLNEIWMSSTILDPDDLVTRIANADGGGFFIGDIVGTFVLVAGPSFSYLGWTNQYDVDTDSVIFYKQAGGNKLLKVNASTMAVTQITPGAALYTSGYNPLAAANEKYYAFRSTSLRIDRVNLATGVSTLFTTTVPPGETFLNESIAIDLGGSGWMLGQNINPDILYKYDLTTGLIVNSFTMPAPWESNAWIVYDPIHDALYIAVTDSTATLAKSLMKFDIASSTFSLVWTSSVPSDGGLQVWETGTDSAPILSYDPYRHLIWFNDGPQGGSFGSKGPITAFSTDTDSQLYSFPDPFPTSSTIPWKYMIAPDSVWVSENDTGSSVQVLRISFPAEVPHLAVTKEPTAGTFIQGGPINFTIIVTNDGDGGSDAHFVQLSDQLPTNGGLDWSGATVVTSQGSCSISAGSLLTCDLGTITAPESATITVTLNTTPAGACQTQSNTVTVSDEEEDEAEAEGSYTCTPPPPVILGSGGPGNSLRTWHKENSPTPWWPGAKVPDLDKMSLFKRLEKRVKSGENIDDAIAALKARGQPKPPPVPPAPKPPLKTHPELDKLMQSLLNKGRGIR